MWRKEVLYSRDLWFVCWHLVRINSFQCHVHASFEDDIGCVLLSLRTKPKAVQPRAEIMTFEIQPAVPDSVLIFWPHFHASTCIMMRVTHPGLIGHHRFRHGLLRTVRYRVFPWLSAMGTGASVEEREVLKTSIYSAAATVLQKNGRWRWCWGRWMFGMQWNSFFKAGSKNIFKWNFCEEASWVRLVSGPSPTLKMPIILWYRDILTKSFSSFFKINTC